LIAAGERGVSSADPPPARLHVERQADAFAEALIAPISEVLALHDEIGHLSAVDLSRKFGYSAPAAEIRLKNIQSLMPRRITIFDPQLRLSFG
jgi:Zn-dependent peptidase ImmA (M78 family)